MGRYGGTYQTMKLLEMCENLDIQTLSNGHVIDTDNDDTSESEVTVKLFDSFEDVNELKNANKQMTETSSDNLLNDDNYNSESVFESSFKNDSDISKLKLNESTGGNCSSTIGTCNLGSNSLKVFSPKLNGICKEFDKFTVPVVVDETDTMGRRRSVSDSKLLDHYGGSGVSPRGDKTKVKAGLLMSPIALTQDLAVNVRDDKSNRLSNVMQDTVMSSLVYLPTTKQLVKQQKIPHNNNLVHENTPQNNVEPRVTDKLNIDANITKNGSSELASPVSNTSISSESCPLTVKEEGIKDADHVTMNTSAECLIPQDQSVHDKNNMAAGPSCNDAISLSSVSTDLSISEDNSEFKTLSLETDETGFMDINLHSRNSYQRSLSNEEGEVKAKKKGFSSFLTRSLFSKKNKDVNIDSSPPGWKLFGQVPPKFSGDKEAAQISSEYHAKLRASQMALLRHKKQDVEVSSTTALILENRPMNLPTKNPEEAEKHRQQYEEMIECARKKEQREFKLRKKQIQNQLKQEDQLAKASKVWNSEILPNWDNMKTSKKSRDLWWHGLPPNVRGKVWKLALGNELNVTAELYEICIGRAEEKIKLMQDSESISSYDQSSDTQSNKEDSVSVIRLDVSRTFPQLCIFQKGGPYHDLLHSLLGAYATYRPDVGYVQGMSFIAGILLLNMEAADAFICFANLLNRPCQVTFFRMDETMMTAYYKTFEEFFKENLPTLYEHFNKQNLTPNLYLIDWIFLMYSKSLPLDVVCRVWDVFWRDGEEFIFRTALGILKSYEKILLLMDFIHIAQFLTKLPEDITADFLFHNIEPIKMVIDKKKFSNILAQYKDSDW